MDLSSVPVPDKGQEEAADDAGALPSTQESASETAFRLTDDQIEEISGLLRAGRQLPPYLFPHLFESAREYELAYSGKARRIDVLAETMAVPLQPVRTFGSDPHRWANMLILGDNLQVLRRLLQMKDAGALRNPDGSDGVRLCYIDPPFGSQREFTGSRNEKAYMDRVAGAEFVEHLRRRLILIRELLTNDGALFLHMDTRKVHYLKVVLDELFGEGNFRNEIIWKRTGAHSGANRYAPVHETLLFYSKSESFIWNRGFHERQEGDFKRHYNKVDKAGRRWEPGELTAPGVRRGESGMPWRGFDPATMGRHWAKSPQELDELDATGKIYWPRKKGAWPRIVRYLDEVRGLAWQDLWTDIPPVNMNAAERVGYPTQKPVALLQRLISGSSNPGDIVLDAFVGSGTTLLAAEQFDEPRRWIAIDSGKFAIYVSQARLLRQAGKKAPKRPFTLFNAGLYDYRSVRDLPWSAYLDFVLQLFQCRRHQESVGGVSFHGFLRDHRVLVFNFNDHPEAKIGRPFVEDIASLCRDRLGTRCFIIAPALSIEPYEDYLDVEGTRFFFLRIPYSIIAELHKRAFSELRQPTSEAAANAPIDSVGFDFIQPPRVECRFEDVGPHLEVEITAFESEAFSAAPSSENIANLAMVMVDYSYDGEVFDLDAVHFAEDLTRQNWRFPIPRPATNEQLMLVYVDVFGNEMREVKTSEAFSKPKKVREKRRT